MGINIHKKEHSIIKSYKNERFHALSEDVFMIKYLSVFLALEIYFTFSDLSSGYSGTNSSKKRI